MNSFSRLLRYGKAWAGLSVLNSHTSNSLDQPERLIEETFRYCDGFLRPLQLPEELSPLIEHVRVLKARTVLEIGTDRGGTLFLWTRMAAPDALIISIDLPGGDFGGGYSPLRSPIYRRFARERQRVCLLRADSHSASTLAQVEALLGGRAVDYLFIDGDHTYDGVRQDWGMYAPLVRPSGIVAFHDVAAEYESTQVKRFWDEIKAPYEYREYAAHPQGRYGIGVLFK